MGSESLGVSDPNILDWRNRLRISPKLQANINEHWQIMSEPFLNWLTFLRAGLSQSLTCSHGGQLVKERTDPYRGIETSKDKRLTLHEISHTSVRVSWTLQSLALDLCGGPAWPWRDSDGPSPRNFGGARPTGPQQGTGSSVAEIRTGGYPVSASKRDIPIDEKTNWLWASSVHIR